MGGTISPAAPGYPGGGAERELCSCLSLVRRRSVVGLPISCRRSFEGWEASYRIGTAAEAEAENIAEGRPARRPRGFPMLSRGQAFQAGPRRREERVNKPESGAA